MAVWLVSALFGIVSAVIVYRYVNSPLVYNDFIAGSLAWHAEGKSKDVMSIFMFIAVTVFSLVGLSRYQKRIALKHDAQIADSLNDVLMYGSIPFVVWVGEQVLHRSLLEFDLLFLNAWVILGGLVTSGILIKDKDWYHHYEVKSLVPLSFILFFLVSIAPNVVSVLSLKLGHTQRLTDAFLTIPFLWVIALFFYKRKVQYLRYSALFFQIIIVGYFALLIPSPYKTEGALAFFHVQKLLYIIVIAIMTYSIYDIYRRFKQNVDSSNISFSLLSPFVIAALLLVMFFSDTLFPFVNMDDYHSGEKLLPLYMMTTYQSIPYVDYVMAHGFIDVFSALGSILFLDGTAATLHEGNRILTALVMLTAYLVTYRYVGILTATILTLLMMPLGIWYYIAVVMSLFLYYVKVKRLGISFLIVCFTIFLLAPGQGAVFIIAIAPLVLYRIWHVKQYRVYNVVSIIAFLMVLMVMFLLAPWVFEMLLFAIYYVLENGFINFQAYGIAWHHSWDSAQTINSSLMIYEVVRNSWVFVPLCFISLWLLGLYKGQKKALLYGLFVTIFVLVMYKYALGRIDPYGLSRMGILSEMAIPLLFLSLYFLRIPPSKFVYWILFCFFWMALLTPQYWKSPVKNAQKSLSEIGKVTDGDEVGIPNLGRGKVHPLYLSELLTIKKIADRFLEHNETFLDITNRGALYYYLDRKMPVEAVFYNQAHTNMQKRSIQKLSVNPPPMSLLRVGNLNYDGRSPAIRTHLVYRWIMKHYIPIRLHGIVIGVHRSKIARFQSRFGSRLLPQSLSEELTLWDAAFALKDLQKLPIAWGASWRALKSKMREQTHIAFNIKHMHNLKQLQDKHFQVTGEDPYIVYDLSKYTLSGQEAGLLDFEFRCKDTSIHPQIKFYWATEKREFNEENVVSFSVHNGHVIVPLDALPRWLRAEYIPYVKLVLKEEGGCQSFSLHNIRLSQRIWDDL